MTPQLDTLRHVPLFRSLTGDETHRLDTQCFWRRYEAKRQILGHGEGGTDVFFVISGVVVITESHVTIPALNLNTNTVTLAAWIKPGLQVANAGVIFCRGGGTVAGNEDIEAFTQEPGLHGLGNRLLVIDDENRVLAHCVNRSGRLLREGSAGVAKL
jgi:hypothetical protein